MTKSSPLPSTQMTHRPDPAREQVRVARALPGLPKISAAFREGRVSFSKVRAMTRVATAANEDVLLAVALGGTASHVERQISVYRHIKRADALKLENLRHTQRELSWFEDDDGSWVFKGRFTAEQGGLISTMFAGKARSYRHESIEFKQPDSQHHQSNNNVVETAAAFLRKRRAASLWTKRYRNPSLHAVLMHYLLVGARLARDYPKWRPAHHVRGQGPLLQA